ncbi:MAG TPA: hypothetical protein VME20_09650 [Acidimicrobiales bacterium]|nr:hypothetical protein [Acidimicrobiales bacterium]
MAEVRVEGNDIVVRLGTFEALVTFRRQVRVPLASLRMVQVEGSPMTGVPLLLVPGLAWAKSFAVGCSRKGGRREFVAVYAHRPAVVVDAEGARWDRLVISQRDAGAMAAELATMLLGRAPGNPARRGAFRAPLE